MQNLHHNTRTTILAVIDFFYPPFKRIMPLQTFRYAACGGANTCLDIFIYFIAYNYILHKQNIEIAHFPFFGKVVVSGYIAALMVAFIVTFPTGFYLSRYVVWQQTVTKKRVQLFRYFMVVLVCIVLNYIFMKFFVEELHFYPTPAKVATALLVVAFSYFSQRHFSFKVRKQDMEL